MSLHLSAASIRSAIALSEKRDGLLAEIQEIDSEIGRIALGGVVGAVSPQARPRKARKTGKRKKHGAVRDLIVAGLHEAGEAGIAVKHLAAKIGIKPANIHVWFATTGKKSGLTEALGKGVYRLKAAMGVPAASSALKAPEPKVTKIAPKTRRRVGKK